MTVIYSRYEHMRQAFLSSRFSKQEEAELQKIANECGYDLVSNETLLPKEIRKAIVVDVNHPMIPVGWASPVFRP